VDFFFRQDFKRFYHLLFIFPHTPLLDLAILILSLPHFAKQIKPLFRGLGGQNNKKPESSAKYQEDGSNRFRMKVAFEEAKSN
jgi:hypothetical protein